MTEQNQINPNNESFEFQKGSSSENMPLPDLPDIEEILKDAEETIKQCCVMHGSHVQYASIGGQTVKQVRKTFRSMFNIPEGARALVKGDEVSEDQIILPGQTIEFIKESGTKGRL